MRHLEHKGQDGIYRIKFRGSSMALLEWLGLISLKRFRALESKYHALQNENAAQVEEVRHLEAALAMAREKHIDVAVMLDKAMETVTSAVGFVAMLDEARRKLEGTQDQTPAIENPSKILPEPNQP